MEKKNEGFLFYAVLATIYGVFFGIIMSIFYIFSEEETTMLSIISQSVAFGVLMGIFEYWRMNRNKKKD